MVRSTGWRVPPETRSYISVAIDTCHPAFRLADQVFLRHAHVVVKDFVESGVAGDLNAADAP